MSNREIFRKVSLERLSSPEQLDLLMQVTNPRAWLALVALGTLIGLVVLWGFLGRIPVESTGSAILLKSGGVKNLVATGEGQVTELYIQAGEVITEGMPVAEIAPLGGGESTVVTSAYTGEILELKADVGSLVSPGAPLASLEFVGEGVQLEAILYVSPNDGKSIQPGMSARVAPATVRPEEYGFLVGQVISVGEFPATYQGILRTLGSDELIGALVTEQAPIEVRVALVPDPETTSGYRWSSSAGPDFEMSSGTLASATIRLAEQRPIDLVLP